MAKTGVGGARLAAMWVLAYVACMGLGYAALQRYDPAAVGNVDARHYFAMVTGSFGEVPAPFRGRVLVPLLARAVYALVDGRLGSLHPIGFSLLVVNSAFCATAALLLGLVASWTVNRRVGLVAALVLLLSFPVTNFHLAGLVDSVELCSLLALTVVLMRGASAWLLPVAIVGVLGKETFAPLAAAYILGWGWGQREGRARILRWGGGMIALLAVTVWTVRAALAMPLSISVVSEASMGQRIGRCLLSHELLYVFGLLAPVGLVRARELPAGWLRASALATTMAFLLAAWIDAQGNCARSMFNVCGPLLCTSVALFLVPPTDGGDG